MGCSAERPAQSIYMIASYTNLTSDRETEKPLGPEQNLNVAAHACMSFDMTGMFLLCAPKHLAAM